MMQDSPSCLFYLLSVGREKEIALQLHGPGPSEEELASWMERGAVVRLEVSSPGEMETFTLLVNFGHVVTARVAPFSLSRSASF